MMLTRAWIALYLSLLCCCLHQARADPNEDAAFNDMLAWLKTEGDAFQANVEFGTNANGVRGMFATKDIPKAGVVISIPPTAVLNVGGYTEVDAWIEPTFRLLAEMRNPHSRFQPYTKVLPARDEIISLCNLPHEYRSMLPPGYWVDAYDDLQRQLRDIISRNSTEHYVLNMDEALGLDGRNVDLDELKYACGAAATRTVVGDPRKTHFLIPIFDMANHRDKCNIYLDEGEGGYFQLVADSDVKEGDEICYEYKDDGRDDDFLFGYGYLPTMEERPWFKNPNGTFKPPQLLSIDLRPLADGRAVSSQFFDKPWIGSHSERLHEQKRLLNVLEDIKKHEEKNPIPDVVPGFEYLHGAMQQLMSRRKEAILAEIERLKSIPKETYEKDNRKASTWEHEEYDYEEEEEEEEDHGQKKHSHEEL